jgi:hypothetical protein
VEYCQSIERTPSRSLAEPKSSETPEQFRVGSPDIAGVTAMRLAKADHVRCCSCDRPTTHGPPLAKVARVCTVQVNAFRRFRCCSCDRPTTHGLLLTLAPLTLGAAPRTASNLAPRPASWRPPLATPAQAIPVRISHRFLVGFLHGARPTQTIRVVTAPFLAPSAIARLRSSSIHVLRVVCPKTLRGPVLIVRSA